MEEEGRSLATKEIQKAAYTKVKRKITSFCLLACAKKLPVNQNIIRERALIVRDGLLKRKHSSQDRIRYENISTSVGWCQKFV